MDVRLTLIATHRGPARVRRPLSVALAGRPRVAWPLAVAPAGRPPTRWPLAVALGSRPQVGWPLALALAGALLLGACESATQDSVTLSRGECSSCHVDAYEASAFGHAGVGYGEACAECHRESDWAPVVDVRHEWALAGAHADASCGACHIAGARELPGSTCLACHAADRDGATPSHARLPDACEACHGTIAWRPASLDHDRLFPLVGAHAVLDCGRCHIGEVYAGTPRVCVGCHAADRDRAVPAHAGFPADCLACHDQVAWRPAALDHDAFWPLRGAHTAAECASCHAGGVYAGTPRACAGCHAADRDRAVPSHAGFPADCAACHSVVAWRPAALDHDTFWPLRGAHATAECASCHPGGVYAGTSRECVGCHADDRARAVPNHAGFPADCAACHGVTAWRPADFEHTAFPVPHRDARACGDCHLNPNDYEEFSCIHCHAHSRAEADDEHLGEVRGYEYSSAACYRCHPRGREDD